MAFSFIDLPKYQTSPLLDLSPINSALGFASQQNQMNQQNARAERSLGMQEKQFSEDMRDRQIKRMGARASAILELKDPAQQDALYQKHFASNPEFVKAAQENGLDLTDRNGVLKTVLSEALGPRDPLESEKTKAAIAASYANVDQSKAAAAASRGGENRANQLFPVQLSTAQQAYEMGKYMPVNDKTRGFFNAKTEQYIAPPDGMAGGGYQSHLDENLAKKNAEDIQSARKASIDAVNTSQTVQQLLPLVPQAFTGSAANQRAGIGRILTTLGVPSEALKNATTANEALTAGLGALTINKAAPLKPVSNTDMAFLEKIAGNPTLSEGGVISILRGLDQIAKREALFNQKYAEALHAKKQVDPVAILDYVNKTIPTYQQIVEQESRDRQAQRAPAAQPQPMQGAPAQPQPQTPLQGLAPASAPAQAPRAAAPAPVNMAPGRPALNQMQQAQQRRVESTPQAPERAIGDRFTQDAQRLAQGQINPESFIYRYKDAPLGSEQRAMFNELMSAVQQRRPIPGSAVPQAPEAKPVPAGNYNWTPNGLQPAGGN